MLDKIIPHSDKESKKSHRKLGTFSFSEILSLLKKLSKNTSISLDNLLLVYADFFLALNKSYLALLTTYNILIEMLSSIENYIYKQVQKMCPKLSYLI